MTWDALRVIIMGFLLFFNISVAWRRSVLNARLNYCIATIYHSHLGISERECHCRASGHGITHECGVHLARHIRALALRQHIIGCYSSAKKNGPERCRLQRSNRENNHKIGSCNGRILRFSSANIKLLTCIKFFTARSERDGVSFFLLSSREHFCSMRPLSFV